MRAAVEPLTEREAIAGIGLMAMYANEVIDEDEDDVLRDRLQESDLFAALDEDELGELLERLEHLTHKHGGEDFLRACALAVRTSGKHRELALEVARDVIEADGLVDADEAPFYRRLEDLLEP